ncbi:MAG: hypothetical protein CMD74_02310 [Gammaproteobacteria bacterium]|nr:hypothetical protein [Gammaproteobacteria bacterium]
METTLANFIRALRNANVRISPAETLDAMSTLELVGYRNREELKRSLSLVLPKTIDDKETYDACFEQFFSFKNIEADIIESSIEPADSETVDQGGDGNTGNGQNSDARSPQSPNKKSKTKKDKQDSVSPKLTEELGSGQTSLATSTLGTLLMTNSSVELTLAMTKAAEEINIRDIEVFTQKGLYTRRIMDRMGLRELNQEIANLRASSSIPDRRLAQELTRRTDVLREQVRDYVEKQFLLNADITGRRLREDLLRRVKLSNIEHRNFRLTQEVVFRLAKKLISLHSRRKKNFKKGQLNVPRTLRRNMAYDGAIFDLHWKSVKIDRPKVFAICDVSGSVSNYARFMLMLLYSLEEVMPKIRSFAFSSDLAEVTELFKRNDIETAITKTLRDYSGGSTDYGQAFADFRKNCLEDLDKRSTIIILGDARNNFGDPKTEILREIFNRSKRVIWLNPEPQHSWGTGDSEMRKYSVYSHQVNECNSLLHLERIVNQLLLVAS